VLLQALRQASCGFANRSSSSTTPCSVWRCYPPSRVACCAGWLTKRGFSFGSWIAPSNLRAKSGVLRATAAMSKAYPCSIARVSRPQRLKASSSQGHIVELAPTLALHVRKCAKLQLELSLFLLRFSTSTLVLGTEAIVRGIQRDPHCPLCPDNSTPPICSRARPSTSGSIASSLRK